MKPEPGCQFEYAVETLLPTLDEAVSSQTIADRPVAAFLSGGVDSSAVVSSMQLGRDTPVTTCAMGFADPAHDERSVAATVANHLGTDHHAWMTDLDATTLAPAIAAIYGEPFADTSALPTVLLCKGARSRATVALSGDGGDEIFAGYERYLGVLNEARVRRLFPEFARGLIGPVGSLYPALPRSVPAPFRLKTALQSVAEDEGAGYARAVAAINPEAAMALLAPEMRDYRPQNAVETAITAAHQDDPVLAAQAADMATWLPGRMLVKVDRASMASGLEVRPPLLDYRLVEWAATLPRTFKMKGATGKRILKEALKTRLPEDILARRKQGFGAPADTWFHERGGALIDNLLARGAWKDSGYFNPDEVTRLAEKHRAKKGRHGQILWTVLMFDAFLNRDAADRALIEHHSTEISASTRTAAVA